MNQGRTVFAQLMDQLPKRTFDKCVRRYAGSKHVRRLPTYVLVAIVKKRLCLSVSPYTILQILSLSLFEKTPILQVFLNNHCHNLCLTLTISPVYRGF